MCLLPDLVQPVIQDYLPSGVHAANQSYASSIGPPLNPPFHRLASRSSSPTAARNHPLLYSDRSGMRTSDRSSLRTSVNIGSLLSIVRPCNTSYRFPHELAPLPAFDPSPNHAHDHHFVRSSGRFIGRPCGRSCGPTVANNLVPSMAMRFRPPSRASARPACPTPPLGAGQSGRPWL